MSHGAILSAVGLSAWLAQCGHSGTFPSSKGSDNGRLSGTSAGEPLARTSAVTESEHPAERNKRTFGAYRRIGISFRLVRSPRRVAQNNQYGPPGAAPMNGSVPGPGPLTWGQRRLGAQGGARVLCGPEAAQPQAAGHRGQGAECHAAAAISGLRNPGAACAGAVGWPGQVPLRRKRGCDGCRTGQATCPPAGGGHQ
jgi:hypothetical protein